MRLLKAKFRLMAFVVCVLFSLAAAPLNVQAQTVSVSPGDLSFAVPTQTPFPSTGLPLASAPDSVTVTLSGTGSVTFSGATVGAPGANPGDFVIDGNSCTGTITSPSTCQVTLHFNASLAPASTLETATLTINFTIGSSPGSLTVPMNGAYGAIKLFSALDINPSLFSGVTWPNSAGNPVNTISLNLSCPANPTAVLSSTPDGSSNVFQDNTIQVADTINGSTTTTTNVCYGGDTNFQGFTGFPAGTSNCFQPSYESAASGFIGQNPDLAGVPASYGVQPLNLMNAVFPPGTPPLYSPVLQSGPQSLSVQLTDAGGDLGAATLHLVTNCNAAGVTPGGSVTLNPIETNNPQTQTQTANLDNSPGQNISFTTSDAVAIQEGTATIPSGIVPIITDIGVPQQLFYQLVTGKSAAPAVCLRMAGELDSSVPTPAPMCKGYLLQCYNPADGTTTGDNCAPTGSSVRNLFFSARFTSPDGPVNGSNFLYGPVGSPAADACSNIVPGGSCANGTGPGLLMGSDNWLCAPGSSNSAACTPLEPGSTFNTMTPPSTPTYSASNCQLTGSLEGALCPFDVLTNFLGAADTQPGGTKGGNSLFIPVVNVPLPMTTTTIAGIPGNNVSGWINSSTVNATFTANAATYPTSGSIPLANGFTPASPYSLTYGISNWPTLPDTTYPVANDVTNQNSFTTANTPFCNSGGTTPATFASNGSFGGLSDGMYNLHYFTTDCAFTEGLVFNPQGGQLTDPTANWASFPFVTVGVDTIAPTFSTGSCIAPAPVYQSWHGTNVTAQCTASDTYLAGQYGSGFGSPLPNSIQGSSPTKTVNVSTYVAPGAANAAAPTNIVPACDLAGNCVNVYAGPYQVDLQPPTIAIAVPGSGSTYAANQSVDASYSCSDGAGSGVKTCSGSVANGTAINTVPNGVSTAKTFTVVGTDNVGNSTATTVNYSVSCHYVVFGVSPTSVNPGGKITITASAMDCMSASQSISLEFIWTGPVGKSCSSTKTVMFTTPYFTIRAGTSDSVSFPYTIPTTACAATHTLTTDTFIAGSQVDSTSVSLTVK